MSTIRETALEKQKRLIQQEIAQLSGMYNYARSHGHSAMIGKLTAQERSLDMEDLRDRTRMLLKLAHILMPPEAGPREAEVELAAAGEVATL